MRLKNIMLTELVQDRLIAYERIEEAMNSRDDIKIKVSKIKKSLKLITSLTLMIDSWEEIMANDISDIKKIKEENKEKDG